MPCLIPTAVVLGLLLLLVAWVVWRGLVHRSSGRPFAALRARMGWGRGVAELAERIGYRADELERLEPRYREVVVPKRRGGGMRRLHVPDDATKTLQRTILRKLLAPLRAHPAATGFERGRFIVDNALPHVRRAVVIKMDVVDFFPSTGADRIDAYFRRIGWNAKAAALLTRLVTYDGGLPQGAPTSPRLSNLVNYGLDVRLAQMAERRSARYTRYADDITFSHEHDGSIRPRGTIDMARWLLRAHGYTAHGRAKTSIRRAHQRQSVTGLIVNDGVRLPRELRRKLRAIRHHVATGRPATLTEEQLRGWAAFEAMVARGSDR
jgi:RNA-directed DNA polymerase